MKKLIVFYSYSNNTRKIAHIIQEKITADILEIEPIIPYTTNYQDLVEEEQAKMNHNEIIEIKDLNLNLNSYDQIIIGSPVWWYTITPPIRSFLEKYSPELKDKDIYAFITNGGWLGHSIEDIEKYLPIKEYLNLEFNNTTIKEESNEKLTEFIKRLEEK